MQVAEGISGDDDEDDEAITRQREGVGQRRALCEG